MEANNPNCVDWQNSCGDNSFCRLYMFEHKKWADCHFLVGGAETTEDTEENQPERETIFGHKLLLSAVSPVFECMFNGNLPEDSNRAIVVTDIEPATFRAMMEYIYADKLNVASVDEACALAYVGKKYLILSMVKKCMSYLTTKLSTSNACKLFEIAQLYEDLELSQASLEFVCSNAIAVFDDPHFIEADIRTLAQIFKQSDMNVDSEFVLYNALKTHVEKKLGEDTEQDQKNSSADDKHSTSTGVLLKYQHGVREALQSMRLLTLSTLEFTAVLEGALSKFLSPAEGLSIIINIGCSTTKTNVPEGEIRNLKYMPRPEILPSQLEWLFKYKGREEVFSESIRFRSSANIFVKGVKFANKAKDEVIKGWESYKEQIQLVIYDKPGHILASKNLNEMVYYNYMQEIHFDNPVEISEHKAYEISLLGRDGELTGHGYKFIPLFNYYNVEIRGYSSKPAKIFQAIFFEKVLNKI